MASLRSFSLLLSLAAPRVAGLAIDSPHVHAPKSVTLSPKARSRMHKSAFEAEFTARLNMTDAPGKTIGLRVDTDTNFEPVTIQHIQKAGLVEDWNKAHPDQQVMVGDQIVKVNHILWHHNSQTFAHRIKDQWKNGMKGLPGAARVLELSIQRPHRVEMKRTEVQRAQRHDQLFSKEFTVDLNTTVGHETGRPLGLGLVSDVDHEPVTVDKVKRLGLVQDWNQAHPEDQVLVGDQIIKVNHIMWHHNSKIFTDRINTQFKLARQSKSPLKLVIQRPRREDPKQTPERTQEMRDQLRNEAFSKEFTVDLNTTMGHETGKPLGLGLASVVDDKPVTVDKVRRLGLVQDWNQAHPEDQVLVGDLIIKVNHIPWHHNSKNFTDRINTQFKLARQSKSPLKLVIQRPWKAGERVSASPAGYVDSVGGSESGNDDSIGPSGYVDNAGGSEEDCPDCVGGSE